MARIALNGFGRIGRAFVKRALQEKDLEIVAINDLGDLENLAYLLRFDSVYGRYDQSVEIKQSGNRRYVVIGGREILFFQEKDPTVLPWRDLDIDVVVEATGVFESYEKARVHLDAGAKRVVLTAPAKDAETETARTVLVGINTEMAGTCAITSNGSCTTNSASPVMQVLHDGVGITKAFLNTVHGYTATQSIVDGPVKGSDFRRGRAAGVNIVPSTTGAAIAVARAIPALVDRFDGVAMRVPTIVGSLSVITFVSARPTMVEEINTLLSTAASQPRWQGILSVTNEPIVSTDIIGNTHAATVDLALTRVIQGDLCTVYSWYDNECGYTNTLVRHVLQITQAT